MAVIILSVAVIIYLDARQNGQYVNLPELEKSNLSIKNMQLTSSSFIPGGPIPARFTCDGEDINPPLEWRDVPVGAKSLAIITDDPDAPGGTWLHWTLWNIDPSLSGIETGKVPSGAVEGMTDFGRSGYGGPCPPSGNHRYYFRIYALDIRLDLRADALLSDLNQAMTGHVIGQAELMGTYSRNQ